MKVWQAIATGALALAVGVGTQFNFKSPERIVGAYTMQVLSVPGIPESGAPYSPHLMTFHEDGNVLMTNPDMVQVVWTPSGPDGTEDSVGMGTWRKARGKVVFRVVQENANMPERTPAPRLLLDFTCDAGKSSFRCTGTARYDGVPGAFPAILVGQRINP